MSDSIDSISVIIPTYNGADKILNTLSALNNQTFLNFEVIIAIDGSTDDTEKVVSSFTYNFKNLSVFRQTNKGRSSIRNFGAKHAHGELLIFYDDDMSPEPDSVDRHKQFHAKYKNAICGGNQLENEKEAKNDFDFFRCFLRGKWLDKYEHELSTIGDANLFMTAANFSIQKYTFTRLGKFDERLNDAEDLEFVYRSINLNVPVYFDRKNIAWHNDFVSCKIYIKRRRQYLMAYQKIHKYIPELIDHRIIALNPIKKGIYNIFSNNFMVRLIEKERITWVPKKIRYKLYDIIITGLGSVYYKRQV